MPILRITKNGEHLCSVGSGDVWMFSANVWGDIWGPEVSSLDVTGGGKRLADGYSDFLMWQMQHPLATSDRIVFHFEEGDASNPAGALFDPDSDDDDADSEMSFPPTDEDLLKLESRPCVNAALNWSFKLNGASPQKIAPDNTRQHVSLLLLWNEEQPDHLRIKLSKASLREIATNGPSEELFLEHVGIGSTLELVVGGLIRIEV